MWATQPHFTAAELESIKVPTWIVDADYDEAIKRENTLYMAAHIPGSGLLILPQVSHFAFLQVRTSSMPRSAISWRASRANKASAGYARDEWRPA